MKGSSTGPGPRISERLIATVCQRLADGQRVRRSLPEKGRLHVDRKLPFLCVYRRPHDRPDAGTDQLIKANASYLIAPSGPSHDAQVAELVGRVVETLTAEFGAFLIVELWSAPDGGKGNDAAVPTVRPTFTVHAPDDEAVDQTLEVLQSRLAAIKVLKQGVEVETLRDGKCRPKDSEPLLSKARASELNCATLGVAVPPVYRSVGSKREFPPLIRAMQRSLGLALRRTFFEFTCSHTTRRPKHYHVLGRKAVVKAVWEIDRRLAEVSDAFDYLLLLNPVNPGDTYKRFKSSGFEKMPQLHYRPLPIDPGLLKRQLYNIPLERVEDPALQHLFQEKQEELELKITMLRDRDTPAFLHESLQLFGAVDDELYELARSLLKKLPKIESPSKGSARVDARGFAERARSEFEHYRKVHPDFSATARIRKDVTGLIVSRGNLIINEELSVTPARVDALLAHEVGTHLVTYYNGRAQPFRQLYSGLASYEELQEGLAVLAEYLVGGLSRGRMRQLAARVVAARLLVEGASFVEVFRKLKTHGFPSRTAHTITMRIYRGGGLTKDVVYLRGLRAVVKYVRGGGELRPLFVGKLALEHIPIMRELLLRKVLRPTPVVPRYLDREDTAERLERIRTGDGSVLQLVAEDEGK